MLWNCVSYSNLRSRLGRPVLYINGWLKDIVTEVLHKKCSTSYNFINSKRLEIPTFQTIRHGKYTFRYQAVKLWNMLEKSIKVWWIWSFHYLSTRFIIIDHPSSSCRWIAHCANVFVDIYNRRCKLYKYKGKLYKYKLYYILSYLNLHGANSTKTCICQTDKYI